MRIFLTFLFSIFLFSCAQVESTYSGDLRISKALLGTWDYASVTNECKEYGFLGFRSNGKYTRSSESCIMADDSFGYYYFGWYVANGYLCFAGNKPKFYEARKNGFSKDHCRWKIVSISKKEIIVHEFNWLKDPEGKSFDVIRIFKPPRT